MADALWDGKESSNDTFIVSNKCALLMPSCQLFSFQSVADVEVLNEDRKKLFVFKVSNYTVSSL